MGTPLQQRSYELTLRVANIWMQGQGAGHALDVHRRLFEAAADLGAWTERAAGSSSRDVFRSCLYEVNTNVRLVKLYIRLLDDLGFIEPEAASPLHDLSEEVHRLTMAALRTARDTSHITERNGQAVHS
ncbi:MAG: hypothetical protein IPH85_01235 [Ignavibacteria bacterium]|nr:hypothetical protein [Ignavibacteria bacterium]MBK6419716.1 hypothetical protein [Ignavibacteria bacterium]MBK7184545.1 hypothetical protein [Ignavibacteria bacterium]MBK7413344.1 hypothetical protein [Ignavibacteria bacterium]MBK7576847.1 hypothetical protein [Ignavibacteria bacterium]